MSCLMPVTGSPSGEFWAWTSGFSARNEYMEAAMTPGTLSGGGEPGGSGLDVLLSYRCCLGFFDLELPL